jgi:hypothetical protein
MNLRNNVVNEVSSPSDSLVDMIRRQKLDFLLYRNADPAQLGPLGASDVRGFHVIRDPRDIIVSGYFSHLHSHPIGNIHFRQQRARLQSVDKTEGLLLEMDFDSRTIEDIYHWNYAQPNVLEMRMEDLIAEPQDGFRRIFQFLQMLPSDSTGSHAALNMRLAGSAAYGRLMAKLNPQTRPRTVGARIKRRLHQLCDAWIQSRTISPHKLSEIVDAHRFEAKTKGRPAGIEDVHHHYRKGVAGDWRNHFEPVHIAEFKRRYNDGLLKLGYESDPDWQ